MVGTVDAAEEDARAPWLPDANAGGGDVGVDARPPEAVDASVIPNCPCFEGDGSYCRLRAVAMAEEQVCALPAASDESLLGCTDGVWSVVEACADGCAGGETAASDACELPRCACFVRVSWCGASAARHGLTLDPPCRVPLVPEHDTDILGCDGDRWIVLEPCPNGCSEQPTGTPDACVPRPAAPNDVGLAPCPRRDRLTYGLHPEASDRLRCAGVTAGRISQTIGNAAASAGYHAADGNAGGQPYCAAVDLRTRDLSNREIRQLLERLGENGFAAWYRLPGQDGWPANGAPHIHAVYAGIRMKAQLREQVRDFLAGRNGLASHRPYQWWTASREIRNIVRGLFSRNYAP